MNKSNFVDPFDFIQFFFCVANEKIEAILRDYTNEKFDINYSNFWLNFVSNFRDLTFIKFLEQTKEAQNSLYDILSKIDKFLSENISTEEQFILKLKKNISIHTQIFSKFYDLYKNISESTLINIISQFKNFEKYFDNFKKFSKFDLQSIGEAILEKPGWAYLDFKGNFIWADSTVSEILFENKDLAGRNLFNDYFTEFSKFNIKRKESGANFYDFKIEEKRNVNLKFTIDTRASKGSFNNEDNYCNFNFNLEDKLFEHLNSVKTLKANFSTTVLQGDEKINCAILMKVYLAKIRENYDDLVIVNTNKY